MATLNIVLDTDELPFLIEKGGQIELSEEAEEAVFKLVAVINKYQEALEIVKSEIVKRGRELSPEFRGLVGDDIKGYIKKGDKYTAPDKSVLPDWALKEVKYKKLDQAEIESYVKEKGDLPKGVVRKSEEDVTSFVLQYDKERAEATKVLLFAQSSVAKKPRRSRLDVSTQKV